jgi:hypothetical protein
VCRVRHCVNPLHLEAVSHHVNIMRARNSEPCPHGSITRRRCKVCKADYMRQFWSTRRKHA